MPLSLSGVPIDLTPPAGKPTRWRAPPEVLELGPGEVHVWRINLALAEERLSRLEGVLSPDEGERAGRFQLAGGRARFVAARAALRGLLGRYVGLAPERIEFEYGVHGKPALSVEMGAGGLCFNLAHSGPWALCGFAWRRAIGVDVERVRASVECEPIAERIFSSRELAWFHSLPNDARRDAFFVAWVRKEAYAKAKGDGLKLPLNRFEVSLLPHQPAALLSAQWDDGEPQRWTLLDLDLAPDFKAALAVEGQCGTPRCFTWKWPAYDLP